MAAVLQLENITKVIKNKPVVNNISFELNSGEILGLLGPNGAGKTTTMKMILGLTDFNKGEIIINGEKNKNHNKFNLGGIIETPEFYPFLSGYENIKYFSSFYNDVKSNYINEILKILNLESVKDKKVKEYSLGMKQRLGLAQALVHRPNLLILDEPMNGLDPYGIKDLRDFLKKIAQEQHTAILISSHIISEIELLCDRILFMKQGSLISSFDSSNLDEQEQINISIRISNRDEAINILSDSFKVTVCNENPSEISLMVLQDEINNILKVLINNDIQIYEIKQVNLRLEDRFIKVMGGNEIV